MKRIKNGRLGPCNVCGNPLKTGWSFCSVACKKTRPYTWRPAGTKACALCGTAFPTGAGARRHHDKATYCSLECQRQARYRRGASARTMSDDTIRYLAGFFDGEGTITAYLSQRNAEDQPNERAVRIRLSIGNTVRVPLDTFCAESGVGTVFTRQRGRYKPFHTWLCNAEAAEGVLRQMRPFLMIKHQQADLAIRIQEQLRDPEKKADRSWQEQAVIQMQTLNGYEGRLRLVVAPS